MTSHFRRPTTDGGSTTDLFGAKKNRSAPRPGALGIPPTVNYAYSTAGIPESLRPDPSLISPGSFVSQNYHDFSEESDPFFDGAGENTPQPESPDFPSDAMFRNEPWNGDRKKLSPLAKRLGEDVPYMLPHPSRNKGLADSMPGVVIGQYVGASSGVDAMNFDASMDDIMDPTAASQGRHGSGQAAPNIAPWLMGDLPAASVAQPTFEPPRAPPARKGSVQVLNHFASVPALPKIRRHGTIESLAEAAPRSGSHPNIHSEPPFAGSSIQEGRSRAGSGDSMQTLSAVQRGKKASSPATEQAPASGGRHPSVAVRSSRLGSTTSNISSTGSGGKKKGGFLGALLKRTKNPGHDSLPPDTSRGSTSGSGSSVSTSVNSQSHHQPSFVIDPTVAPAVAPSGYFPDGAISPSSRADDLRLDMDLDDMSGIVNATMAPGSSGQTSSSGSFPLDQTSSLATSVSSGPPPGRSVIAEAQRLSDPQFARNPFGGSADKLAHTPPSPHNLSPKHSLPPNAQPRRPSQLRHMKMGSVDSNASTDGPMAPGWLKAIPSGPTMFNDPFGSAKAPVPAGELEGIKAAWAAPESWGVEGDEDQAEDGTSSEEEGWNDGGPISPGSEKSSDALHPPDAGATKPPPFGSKSDKPRGSISRPATANTRGQRTRTSAGGRPSTATRPGTARPGTSGSAYMSSPLNSIRIYRADGAYTLLQLPLLTTTAEVISTMNSTADGPKKSTTSMRLYIRERGQDRLLLPSEKPLAIQTRRLLQAGYTEAEGLEEIAKGDLQILCKFIYQTPVLPVMDPEEESSYDSFEFIDVGGRDLQTIPIFLHMHAHNIIILNISRNPMTDLPLDFIQACSSLKELRMTNMALKRVPAALRASNTLARLDVSCNRIADLESVPLHEITTLTSLKVQNNKLTSVPSYFVQMQSLKYLNISNNKFETLPSVVCEMSNLVDLDASFNTISKLPSEMSNLKSLERLLVFGNEITTFPASFSTLANLRELDVRRNKLTDLTSVYALPNLETLLADNNNLVTLDAQIGAKVRQFSVPHNSITRFTLAPQMAVVTYSLTHLNLSHGKISSVADEALNGLVNLVDLNLNFNQFTRLPSLERLVNLEIFSCTDNLLNVVPTGFAQMHRLKMLNVHNNNLRSLTPELWMCTSVVSLNASSNLLHRNPDLSSYSKEVAANGPPVRHQLERLYLADNRFTDDCFHAVSLLDGLKILNLSFNEIYEVPPDTLGKNVNLEQLYLSGNKLTSLPSEDLEKLQSLRILHLNGNKLQTLPSELGAIKSLQHLDVGSNVLKYNIANWPYDWNWNWNTGLRYLNLSGNKRLEIKPTSAQDMSHASSFRKELSDFSALTHLRILGLMDITLRIPFLPDEGDDKRVRTSFSDINNMRYGISDMLGSIDHLAMFDMVVPNFRGKDNECVFGMFGRAAPLPQAGRISRALQEAFAPILTDHLAKLQPDDTVSDALRRTFLEVNRKTFLLMCSEENRRKGSTTSLTSADAMFRNWAPAAGTAFRASSSGAVVYLVDKVLHVGNVGDTLAVISRKGEAELLSKHHDPTDREETARVRRAEAWVSTKGFVNDDKDLDISRAFGFWQTFPVINADPEIRTRQLAESDEFVIIGNHALWKCCSYQTAVDIARTERDDPMMAAQKLRDFAISYGADESVMIMVVNISDLFFSKSQRLRSIPTSQSTAVTPGEDDYIQQRMTRRRQEEVGDRTLNRLQQEIAPPTGQVAIVFTDIVNSTSLWETNPSMPTAIKMHHSFMRRQLRLDGGYEVKTEGDSFMVSFQSVSAAVLWAFNCQIGLLQQEWPRELLEAPDGQTVYDSAGNIVQRGLRVRMGVHWGAPSCEQDPITRRMDYYGPMVNRAARINASADGGQLMASQDVLTELGLMRDYLWGLDEEKQKELPAEMKREWAELRGLELEVKDMGERKLKGLEVPEKLHLLYPKCLAGRLELSDDLRANAEVNDARPSIAVAPRQIDIDQVVELSKLTLRLEALSAMSANSSTDPSSPGSPRPGPGSPRPGPSSPRPGPGSPRLGGPGMEVVPSKRSTRGVKSLPPSYLGPNIHEDMTDDELAIIIESLTTRIENCMSTLYIKNLGGFSSVLAALEQATKIDQNLIVHAMSLMQGMMESRDG